RSTAPAVSDRLAPSQPATRREAQQRPRPDAEIGDGEVSFLNLPSRHSITSSASASSLSGILRPSAFAAFRLMINGSDGFAPSYIDRGNSVSGRQCDNPFQLGVHERADARVQRASPTLDERCKGGVDFAVAANIEDDQLLPNGQSRSPQL